MRAGAVLAALAGVVRVASGCGDSNDSAAEKAETQARTNPAPKRAAKRPWSEQPPRWRPPASNVRARRGLPSSRLVSYPPPRRHPPRRRTRICSVWLVQTCETGAPPTFASQPQSIKAGPPFAGGSPTCRPLGRLGLVVLAPVLAQNRAQACTATEVHRPHRWRRQARGRAPASPSS
jgi:hypothetical protein